MMNNLFLEDGSEVILRNAELRKGNFIVLQPHETAFIDLSNPKAMYTFIDFLLTKNI